MRLFWPDLPAPSPPSGTPTPPGEASALLTVQTSTTWTWNYLHITYYIYWVIVLGSISLYRVSNEAPASCCLVDGFMCTKPEPEPPNAYNTVEYLALRTSTLPCPELRETNMYSIHVFGEWWKFMGIYPVDNGCNVSFSYVDTLMDISFNAIQHNWNLQQ